MFMRAKKGIIKMKENFNPHEVLENKDNLICTCPQTDCEWFGKCQECVALHRYCETVPNCLDFSKDE